MNWSFSSRSFQPPLRVWAWTVVVVDTLCLLDSAICVLTSDIQHLFVGKTVLNCGRHEFNIEGLFEAQLYNLLHLPEIVAHEYTGFLLNTLEVTWDKGVSNDNVATQVRSNLYLASQLKERHFVWGSMRRKFFFFRLHRFVTAYYNQQRLDQNKTTPIVEEIP